MAAQERTGYGLAFAAATVWAATGPGIKFLLDMYQVPALTLAFWRDAFIALVCLLGLAALRPGLLVASRRELRGFALVGAISIGLYHALWVLSIALNGAAVAIVLIYTFPSFVTLGAWLFWGERARWPQVAALVVVLVGCGLLVRVYDPAVFRASWLGTLVGLLTAVTHAGYVLFSQRVVQSRSPWTSLAYTMLFGALTLLAMSLVLAPADIGAVGATPAPWLILLALALGPTLGGYALFTNALRHIPGSTASLVSVIEAPIATVLSVVLLREQLELAQIAGIALVLGAIVLPRLVGQRPVRQPLAGAQVEGELR